MPNAPVSPLECQQIGPQGSGETLAEQVYRKLGAAILDGVLPPGAKISEPALARQYGVSRGPLREALHRLQERRLITRSANQGPRVVQASAEALSELFVVREALEGMAARQASLAASDVEIAGLRKMVGVAAPGAKPAREGFDEHQDQDFHVAIARLSRNPLLIDLLCNELYPLLRFYRGLPLGTRPRHVRAVTEHERIVSAIEDRDPELAELMMRRHISAARNRRQSAIHEG